jgi:hypothetical protein
MCSPRGLCGDDSSSAKPLPLAQDLAVVGLTDGPHSDRCGTEISTGLKVNNCGPARGAGGRLGGREILGWLALFSRPMRIDG